MKGEKKRKSGEAAQEREGSLSASTAATAATATTSAVTAAAATPQFPQKKYFRQRAHANPFSDHALEYPVSPDSMDWAPFYPAYATSRRPQNNSDDHEQMMTKRVEIADIGCGFGGLLFALSPRMPETLILGLEIRSSVAEFVQRKVQAMRSSTASTANSKPQTSQSTSDLAIETNPDLISEGKSEPKPSKTSAEEGPYQNIAILRANTMKFLPNIFYKSQLRAIFLAFPDPHFKSKKHKARIVSGTLTAEYAYILRPGGIVYTITDVRDLHEWMARYFDDSVLFQRIGDDEMNSDELAQCMRVETEEGKKVQRNGGEKFLACWRRLDNPPWPEG